MIPPPTAVGGQQLAIATEHLKKKYEHKTQIQNTKFKALNTRYKTQKIQDISPPRVVGEGKS